MMDESFFATLYSEDKAPASTTSLSCAAPSPAAADSPPDEFLCPISLQPMVHPLTTRSGLNFERSAILNWLQQGSGVCPLTRQPLRPSDLIPNRQLETRIRFWRLQNNIPEPESSDDDFAAVSFLGFLPVGEIKSEQLVSRHESASAIPPSMSLRDAARAEMRSRHRMTIEAATARTRSAPTHLPLELPSSLTRRPKEGRRSFLSRILKQTTEELDSL